MVNADNSIWYTSFRFLDPDQGNETYVINLNETINMICAYRTNTYSLMYHGINKFWWTMTINGYQCPAGGCDNGGGGGGGGNDSPTTLIVIGSVGGGLLVIALIVGGIMYMKKKKGASDEETPLNATD